MANVTLEQVNRNILNIRKEIVDIREEIKGLKDFDLEVRPEYLERLKQMEKGRFYSREELEKEMAK